MNKQNGNGKAAVILVCTVTRCGREVAEDKAQVPPLPVMMLSGTPLAELKVRDFLHCETCVCTGYRFGQKFFSLRGTEIEVARRLEARQADKERQRAIRDAVVKGCTSCGKPVAFKDTVAVPGQPGRFCGHCGAVRLADIARSKPKAAPPKTVAQPAAIAA